MLEFIRKCFQADTKDMKKTNRRNRGLRIENCEERVLLTVSPLQADLPEVEQTSYSALDFSAEQGILEAVNINVENGSNLSNSLQAVSDEGGIITPMNAVTQDGNVYTFAAVGDTATIAGIEFTATEAGSITVDDATNPTKITEMTGTFTIGENSTTTLTSIANLELISEGNININSGTGLTVTYGGVKCEAKNVTITCETIFPGNSLFFSGEGSGSVDFTDYKKSISDVAINVMGCDCYIDEITYDCNAEYNGQYAEVELTFQEGSVSYAIGDASSEFPVYKVTKNVMPENSEVNGITFYNGTFSKGTKVERWETTDVEGEEPIVPDVLYIGVTVSGNNITVFTESEGTQFTDIKYDTTFTLANGSAITLYDGVSYKIFVVDNTSMPGTFFVTNNSDQNEKTKNLIGVESVTQLSLPDLNTPTVTGKTASLTWATVENASGYTCEWSTDGATWSSDNVTVSETSATISGLTIGTGYYFRVKANGSGSYTESAWAQTTTAVTPIATPENITTSATSNSITVGWDAVSGAAGYTYQYKKTVSETWTTVSEVTGVSVTVNDLDAGTSYDFQVKGNGSTAGIESEWSEIKTAIIAESGTQLAAPTGFTATPQEERVLLSWTAVEGNTYTVNYKLANGTEWTSFTGTTTGGTATVSGLTAEKPYDFQIQAKKGTDTSGYATISATPDTALATPTITVSNITANSVTVSWTADSAPVPTYVLKYSTNNGVTWTPVEGATNGGTINDLDSNTSYMFSVTAETTGYTTQVATETKLTLPAAPTGLTATANGDDWVTVSWTAPTGNGTITGYTLEYRAGDSGEWTDTTFTGTGTSYVHKGLDPVTTYHYRVKSTNASGSSAYTSENVIATTKAALATPTITVATAVSSSSVTVNWNVTGETETGASYEVQYSSNNWTNTLSVSATPGSTTVTGLEPDTPYVFRVVAKAEGYDSQTSSEVTAKTYNAPVTVGGLIFTPGEGGSATEDPAGTVTITGPVTVAETDTDSYTGGVSVIIESGADLDGTLSLNGTETFKVGDTTYTNVSGTTNLTITDSSPSVAYDKAYSVATSEGTTTYSKVAQEVNGLTFTPATNSEITVTGTVVDVTSGTCNVTGTATGNVTMVGTGFNTTETNGIGANAGVALTIGGTTYTEKGTDVDKLTIVNGELGVVTDGVFQVGTNSYIINSGDSITIGDRTFSAGEADAYITITDSNVTVTQGDLIVGSCPTAIGTLTVTGGTAVLDNGANVGSISGTATTDPLADGQKVTVGGKEYTDANPTGNSTITFDDSDVTSYTGAYSDGTKTYSHVAQTVNGVTFTPDGIDSEIIVEGTNKVTVSKGEFDITDGTLDTTDNLTIEVEDGVTLDNSVTIAVGQSLNNKKAIEPTTAEYNETTKAWVYTGVYQDGTNIVVTAGKDYTSDLIPSGSSVTINETTYHSLQDGTTITVATNGTVSTNGVSYTTDPNNITVGGEGNSYTTTGTKTINGHAIIDPSGEYKYSSDNVVTLTNTGDTVIIDGNKYTANVAGGTINLATSPVTLTGVDDVEETTSYTLNGLIFTPVSGGTVEIDTTNSTATTSGTCFVFGTATGNVTMLGNGLDSVPGGIGADDNVALTIGGKTYTAKGTGDDKLTIVDGDPAITAGVFQVGDEDGDYQFVNGTTTINGVIYTGTGTVTSTGVITSGSFDVYCATTGAKTVSVGDTTSTISINNTDPAKAITVTSGKALTLDIGEDVTVTAGKFTIGGTGSVTIENGSSATIDGVKVAATANGSATLDIVDGEITVVSDGDATLTGGTIESLEVHYFATINGVTVDELVKFSGNELITVGKGTFYLKDGSVGITSANVVELNSDAIVEVTKGTLATSGYGYVDLKKGEDVIGNVACTNDGVTYTGEGVVVFASGTEVEVQGFGLDGNVAITDGKSGVKYTLGRKGDSLTYEGTTTYTAGSLYNDNPVPVCATLTRNGDVVTGTGNYYVGNTYYFSNEAGLIDAIGMTTDPIKTITMLVDFTVPTDKTIPAGVTLVTGGKYLTAPNGVTISVKGAITTASPEQLITAGTGKFVFEAGDDSKLIVNQTEYIGKNGAIVITAGTLDVQTSVGNGFNATLSGTSPAVTIQKGNGQMFGAGLDANIFYMGAADVLDVTAGTLKINTPVDCTGKIVSGSENITLDDNSYLIYVNKELQGNFTNPELTLIERYNDNGRVGYYPNLQIALNNASSVEDVIKLTCDIENQSLIVTKPVTIDGKKDETSNYLITGNGTQPIFDVDANGLELRLQNLDLTNGKSHDVGGGIRNTTNSSLTLTSVMFEDCFAPIAGGAIYSEGNVTISGTSTFSGNSSARGGAIYLEKGATITINGDITTSELYTDNGYLKQYPVVFTGNEATSYCAGIYASGNVNITGTSFTENKGSAVYITSSGTTNTFTSTDFVANTNTALVIQRGAVTLNGAVVFAGNTGNKGGAIYLAGGTLESGTTVTASTHALYKLSTVTGVAPNTTTDYAAQFFGNEGTYGGAINASGTANLSNMYFERNQAVYGGAAYGKVSSVANTTMTMNYASFHGGAIYNTGTEIAATNAVIKNNWAGVNYGAVYGAVSDLSTTNPNFVVNAGHAKGIVNNSVANNAGLMAMPAGGEGTAESEMYKMYKYSSLIITDTTNTNYVSDSDIAETNAANAQLAFEYLTINTGTDGLKVDTVTTGMSTVFLSTDYEQYVSPNDYTNLKTKETTYNWLRDESGWEFRSSTPNDQTIVQEKLSSSNALAAACDFDDSGKVDMVDFVDFAQSFNSTDSAKDFDGNGKVDMADFIHFAQQFNKQVLDLAQESAQEMLAMKAAELPEVPTAQPVAVVEAAPVVEAVPAALPEAAPVVIDAPKAAAAKPAENFWDSYDALGDSIETPVVTPVSEDGSLFDEEPVELFESEDAEALDTEL